jgi:hypothetical protein
MCPQSRDMQSPVKGWMINILSFVNGKTKSRILFRHRQSPTYYVSI